MSIEIQNKVRQFIASNFYLSDPFALADSDSLLDTGVVDSTGVLEVINFLEEEFGISVADDEVLPQNLDSVERLTAYTYRKLSAPPLSQGG